MKTYATCNFNLKFTIVLVLQHFIGKLLECLEASSILFSSIYYVISLQIKIIR